MSQLFSQFLSEAFQIYRDSSFLFTECSAFTLSVEGCICLKYLLVFYVLYLSISCRVSVIMWLLQPPMWHYAFRSRGRMLCLQLSAGNISYVDSLTAGFSICFHLYRRLCGWVFFMVQSITTAYIINVFLSLARWTCELFDKRRVSMLVGFFFSTILSFYICLASCSTDSFLCADLLCC